MSEKHLSTGQILSMLAKTPPRLADLTVGLSPPVLRTSPSQDEWSANEVLAHLRSCADVWGHCIRRILTEDRPTIKAVNPRTWINKTDYPEQEFQPSLQAFSLQRIELLAVLEPLPPESWSRPATVTGAGKPLVRTIFDYAKWMAHHERPHIKQIERIAARFS